MATTKNNTTATTNEDKNAREYDNIVAKVVKVMTPQQNDDRITFVLDKEFSTIDLKTGEEKVTNMFGLNIYNVVNQVSASVPEIQLADTLAMGQMVNPQIIALAMMNADIEVTREFHEKGEKRENTNDTYTNDCIVSKIVSVKPHIHPTFSQMLMTLVTTKPAIVRAAAIPNPFAM